MNRFEDYAVGQMCRMEDELMSAHALLDKKGMKRWAEGHGSLTLVKRILLAMGEPLPDVTPIYEDSSHYPMDDRA